LIYLRNPSSLAHDPRVLSPEHPDTPERIEAVDAAMLAAGWAGCEVRTAPAATEAELLLVHSSELVTRIRGLCEAGGGQIDSDTFAGESSYRAALDAAGGAVALTRALLGGEAAAGFCGLRPSGHHADRTTAMGFCLFNNVAIAAEVAVRELGLERVLIFDWDVHHGNGTAEIFRRRRDVLVASVHQSGLYPGTGAMTDMGSGDGLGFTINIPVPVGSGEDVWLSVTEHLIVPVALGYRPQLILISAGFDAHRADPLGGCLLEASSFAQMAAQLRDAAVRLGVPVGAVLEGGYEPTALAESVVATVAALGGEGEAESAAPDQIVTPRAAAQIGRYWEL
jgi:acetoin utilization deacetylase AcuC-like enzyme